MTAHAWGALDDALTPWRRVEVTDGERSRTVTADVCACRRCGLVLARQESGVRAVGLDLDALAIVERLPRCGGLRDARANT